MRGLAVATLLALAAPLPAQDAAPAPPGYVLPDTEVHVIEAKALGRSYELHVALPPGYADNPDRRYPVLFTTDSPQSFPLIRGIHLRERVGGRVLEDAIIVGLGYSVGDDGTHSRRRDYTPSPHGDIDARPTSTKPVEYGEAEAYRRHIRDEVFPFLEGHYRIDPARRIYAGHSYGGLFGTHVLLTEPTMFARYILMSPSLWYDRRLMIARERGFAMRNRDLPAEVFCIIGGEETVPDPDTEPFAASRHAMVEDMAEMVRMLRSRTYPSLKLESLVIPDEDHASVYVPAIRRGLHWALPGSGRTPHRPCLDEAGRPVLHCRMPWAPRER
ncbi:MAG: alpha/beta hydrolase [Sphingomonadaceae bacterium]